MRASFVPLPAGDRITVFVKEAFPGNGRFHVTLDPDIPPEDVAKMKNAVAKKKARFARRKDASELVEGQEMLGGIVRVRIKRGGGAGRGGGERGEGGEMFREREKREDEEEWIEREREREGEGEGQRRTERKKE